MSNKLYIVGVKDNLETVGINVTETKELKKATPAKIDNIVIRGACLNGEHHWVVYFYDNSGNEMERKRFTDWADAGEYAMKLETFWKYNRG